MSGGSKEYATCEEKYGKEYKDCKGCDWKKHVRPEYQVGEYTILRNSKRKVQINYTIGTPNALGHFVVQPSWPVRDLWELDDGHGRRLLACLGKIAYSIKVVLNDVDSGDPVKKVYVASFNETKDWHLHFHLVARRKQEKDNLGPCLLKQEKKDLTDEEKIRVVEELRKRLEDDGLENFLESVY